MAGMGGFEPPHDGIKTRCLTTWRHPNFLLVIYLSLEQQNQTTLMAVFPLLTLHLLYFQRL